MAESRRTNMQSIIAWDSKIIVMVILIWHNGFSVLIANNG